MEKEDGKKIGPLKLDATRYTWFKRECWNSTQPDGVVTPKFDKPNLYDGGVYDNLGIEPLFVRQAFQPDDLYAVDNGGLRRILLGDDQPSQSDIIRVQKQGPAKLSAPPKLIAKKELKGYHYQKEK